MKNKKTIGFVAAVVLAIIAFGVFGVFGARELSIDAYAAINELVDLLIKSIVLYDDRIEITYKYTTSPNPDDDNNRDLIFYSGSTYVQLGAPKRIISRKSWTYNPWDKTPCQTKVWPRAPKRIKEKRVERKIQLVFFVEI